MASGGLQTIACPFCHGARHRGWAEERGFQVVRCEDCGLLFCNPRPPLTAISDAVRTGMHRGEAESLDVRARRVGRKVRYYHHVLGEMFADLWRRNAALTWLDVGAGYGELVEAVNALAPAGSTVAGLEPMVPKAEAARARGLNVREGYLHAAVAPVEVISLVDVFSHLPDFRAFLGDVRQGLRARGELFIETGNLADLRHRDDFFGELGLPDHLVFAGERHLVGYLEEMGFEIVTVRRQRVDTAVALLKNVAKRLLGRPVKLRVPYTSAYRQLQIRARLRR
jgi:SAM-dependent methyltransferase